MRLDGEHTYVWIVTATSEGVDSISAVISLHYGK